MSNVVFCFWQIYIIYLERENTNKKKNKKKKQVNYAGKKMGYKDKVFYTIFHHI